ncbi:hypothetical protein EJB05_24856, partial [Eragrostis curvula]
MFSCGKVVHRSRGDPRALAFVTFSYLDLVLLLCCLWWHERADPGSKLSHRLKMVIWLLTVALTSVFAYRVAAVMLATYAAVLWVVALVSAAGGGVRYLFVREADVTSLRTVMQKRGTASTRQGAPRPSMRTLRTLLLSLP